MIAAPRRSGGEMKLRIALWAAAGALVVVFWSLYISATKPTPLGSMSALLDLTCPIALARHYPMSIYFVLLANAATYALIGAAVEFTRRQYKRTSLIAH
jgi:hypothetical protein